MVTWTARRATAIAVHPDRCPPVSRTASMTATIAPGPGQQRRAERHQRDVDVPGRRRRLVRLAGEQLQRDEQQQQAAGELQRRARRCAGSRGSAGRTARRRRSRRSETSVAWRAAVRRRAGRHRRGQREEDRDGARRVHDDEEREERRRHQRARRGVVHGRTTGRCPSLSIGLQDGRGGGVLAQPVGLARAVVVARAGAGQPQAGRQRAQLPRPRRRCGRGGRSPGRPGPPRPSGR